MLFTSFIQILLSTTSPTESSMMEINKRILKSINKPSSAKKIKTTVFDKKEQKQSTFYKNLQN